MGIKVVEQFFNQTDLVEIADNNGVVLVYPQGSDLPVGASHWNAAHLAHHQHHS